jgi:glycosyltransferase involved in cell wall biosynthesis
MKLSIILIAYNQEETISQSIDSILMQNLPIDFEIIVADDFSSDKTMAIIKNKLIDKVENLIFLENSKNIGISKNYQRAFLASKGEYIAVMEGDDYWTNPNRLIKHIEFLDFHRECVMSMNRFIVYNQNKKAFYFKKWNSNDDYIYINTTDTIRDNKLGNLSACVFRKSGVDLLKPDLFDLSIADWMLGIVLSQYGFIAILKEMTSVYRIHNLGVWSNTTKKEKKVQILKSIDVYNKYLEYRYNKDFTRLKGYKSGKIRYKFLNYEFADFLPPIIFVLIKLIIPKIILLRFKHFFSKLK